MRLDSLSPNEVVEAVAKLGAQKGNMRPDKVFLSAVSAGCLLAFACGTALSTNATPWFQENAPGLIRTISALVFPYGLCMIILTGADLCTGSFMVCLLGLILGCRLWLTVFFLLLVYYRRCSPATINLVEDVGPLGYNLSWKLGRLSLCRDHYIRV